MPLHNTLKVVEESITLRLREAGHAFYTPQDIRDAYNDGVDELAEATGFCERVGGIVFVDGQRLYDMRTQLIQLASNAPNDGGFWAHDHTRLASLDGSISDAELMRALSGGFAYTNQINYTGLPWSEFLYPTHCFSPTPRRWLHPVMVEDLERIGGQQWRTHNGEPYCYYQQGQWHIGLYPTPNYNGTATINGPGIVLLFFAAIPTQLVNNSDEVIGLPEEFNVAPEEWAIYDLLCQQCEPRKAVRQLEKYQQLEAKLKLEVSRLREAQRRVLGVQVSALTGYPLPFGGR